MVLSTIPVLGSSNNTKKPDINTRTLSEGGWIENYTDFSLLYLNGTNYEMGYQHGSLASDKIRENYRAITNALGFIGIQYTDLLEMWEIQRPFIPTEYLDEIQGMSDGSGLEVEKIGVMQIVDMFYRCCGASAWGPATSDGTLIQLRSFDYYSIIKDPETGTFMQENQLIILRNPATGYASLTPVYAGLCGMCGGINEQQISIGLNSAGMDFYQPDATNNGTPMVFRMRYALDHSSTVQEAISILNTHPTVGYNYIISDGKEPIGYVLEQTANFSYNGTYDNPVESNAPFFSIDHVVRRTNLFISPECSAQQRVLYNPAVFGYARWILYKLSICKCPYYREYLHYKALSKELKDHWGDLDLNITMECLRDVYNYKTNTNFPIWQSFRIIFPMTGVSLFYSLHQWVACPETGDIIISFANANILACENTVYQFNFYNLLDS